MRLAGVLAPGLVVAVAAAQSPTAPRQAGTAEWVRALPVGNGRLGAMVFGGVVHER